MKRKNRWQFMLICTVLILAVYNILPTLFFYSKPLSAPIDKKRSEAITISLMKRANGLENEALSWVKSYCQLLTINPESITLDPLSPQYIIVSCKAEKDAAKIEKHLDRAGHLINFYPSQLSLLSRNEKTVTLQRRIPIHFDEKNPQSTFHFGLKQETNGAPSSLYKALIEDRALELCTTIGGPSSNALHIEAILQNPKEETSLDLALGLSQNIVSAQRIFSQTPSILKRYYAAFSQVESLKENLITHFESTLSSYKMDKFKETLNILSNNKALFESAPTPLNYASSGILIQNSVNNGSLQTISLNGKNPFIESITINWALQTIDLNLYEDVKTYLANEAASGFIYSEIAQIARTSAEAITPFQGKFQIQLSSMPNGTSFLAMKLSAVAKGQIEQLKEKLSKTWNPESIDLSSEVYPILDWETFKGASKQDQNLALVFFAPSTSKELPPQGFRMNSLYIVAKGFDKMLERHRQDPNSAEAKKFMQDFQKLQQMLMNNGFVGYSGKSYAISSEFASDFIFEARDYYQWLLGSTRENFTVQGTKRYAVLEFSNVEERILTENKIDSATHEDLLKWRDDYHAAKLGLKGMHPYDVPKPTSSPLWSNFNLSLTKYFRGDDRKILRWGLDLSGGKTVQLELRDASNKVVTNPDAINQGMNELYTRVNKMGVSEVSIRAEGNTITLDFPGSQSLSAAELVKASSMYFHVVNEQFGPFSKEMHQGVNRFLQEVWDEAVISGKKDPEEINTIAWRRLNGNPEGALSESAHSLYNAGLRLASPTEDLQTSAIDTSLCKLALYKGGDFTEWHGQTHPLIIVFKNFALEGSNLDNIRASYDPSKGNFLSFGVKGGSRDDLSNWTSAYAKDKIVGTPKESFSNGKGWRMAVILNGYVVAAPTLDSPLRDSASITGSFTQREITQLENDLKAGSLSFSPHILSEKNISPELGQQERTSGILATCTALLLVIVVMVAYYHFGGVIAAIAVIINLLMLWAVLVNIGATLTLANIAGLILTVGMAVDANVLVFERIREEFKETGRIATAVHAGYKKAFSAILDSNLTTIIAALILLNFDSGPVKGFALTLIIGIFSSMFTALFMTKAYFFEWVKNPKNTMLSMSSWIKETNFPFLKFSKPTLITSLLVIVLGGGLVALNKDTLLGMDFRGGYSLNLELEVSPSDNYRQSVEKALLKAGIAPFEMQLRELSPTNHIKLFLSKSLELKGHPFFGMPQAQNSGEALYPYQNDPRLNWIVTKLQSSGIALSSSALQNLDKNWTVVSGQISDTMRNNALIGLALALFCILIYITLRFEIHYAISATICLTHDLLFTLAIISILNTMGVSIQIDLNCIAALMTIVGYSLNDTIIVFDRIREDLKLHRKLSLSEVITHSLNATLSRTLLTSGTTLIVLIPMIFMGGSTIFGFALVMAIGVIFGTLSSLFIAAPLMQYFAEKREKNKLTTLKSHDFS